MSTVSVSNGDSALNAHEAIRLPKLTVNENARSGSLNSTRAGKIVMGKRNFHFYDLPTGSFTG